MVNLHNAHIRIAEHALATSVAAPRVAAIPSKSELRRRRQPAATDDLMSLRRIAARAALALAGVLAWTALMAAPSLAAGGVVLCIKPGGSVTTPPMGGTCPSSSTPTLLGAEGKEGKQGATGAAGATGATGPEGKNALSEEELATLKGILPCIKSVKEGVDKKPTVQFSGCNVQVVSGEKEAETNGLGNLVIGADENPRTQSGSNNLVVGTEQEFTSYGGILAGVENVISGPFATVSGGGANTASGVQSSVSGGLANAASGTWSSVSGGGKDTASGELASVSGGDENTASGTQSSVSGGGANTASGIQSSVGGGLGNKASGIQSSVGGGGGNTASGEGASVSGGVRDTAGGVDSSVSGGVLDTASGEGASVSGGDENKATAAESWIGGGVLNEVFDKGAGEDGLFAAIFGGEGNKTAVDRAALPGCVLPGTSGEHC